MQCPNCGRNVRSKNQCAYCGHVFNKQEVAELKEETRNEDVVQETPRRSSGGFSRVLWGIIKLVLAVAIVFLAFLYGPRIINQVVDYFQTSDTEVVQNTPEEPVTEAPVTEEFEGEEPSEDTQDSESETEDSAATSETEESTESSESEESNADGQLSIVNQEVNLDEYPLTNVALEFNESLDNVDSTTFNFTIDANGETVELEDDYSLVKDGQTLTISFNDPSVAVLSTDAQEQVLNVESESLGVSESISYEVPTTSLDTEQAEFFNSTITDNLASIGDVSAVVYPQDAEVPYVYDDQSVEADALISWFVLGFTFNAIEDGELTLEDPVVVSSDLVAENDEGIVATAEEGTEFTIQELLSAVVEANDVSAMNHLIQETGGPNAFNLWLNESNYFSTRVTQMLTMQESGQVTGAVTSAQDIAQLLNKLANNELVSEEADATIKELLLNTPVTTKYPEGQIAGYQTRYEIASADTNTAQQNYAGIVELEDTYYITVILTSNFTSAEEVVPAISTSISDIVTYFETGQTPEEVAEEEAAAQAEEEAEAQAQAEAESLAAEEAAQSQVNVVDESSPETGTVGEDGRTYSNQYVDNIGSYVNLPEETVYDETTGETRPAEWFFDESDGRYYYR
ncbi:MAG: serine hydrolase [Ruoffia tabacinasalis]